MKTIYTCFPNGKHKVLTMSYDDGRMEDYRLLDIFNRNGIKGTFHLNSGLIREDRIPVSEFRKLYQGHEISAHTYTHPTIARCPIDQVVTQIMEDRKGLEAVCGYPVRGMSYPNGSFSREIVDVLPALGIRYARVVATNGGFGIPEDFLRWEGTCHHNQNLIEKGEEFLSLHKTQYLYMMYVWGHSYEFTNDNNWEVIETFCRMAGNKDDIWYATNIEIVDYLDAAKRLQYTASGDKVYNPSWQSVWISVNDVKIEVKGGQLVSL